MSNIDKIADLAELWGKCCIGHHKSKDHHFYINQVFTCGNIEYSVEHYSYLMEDFSKTFDTLKAAELYLITKIAEQISDRANQSIRRMDSGDYDSEYDDGGKDYWSNILKQLDTIKSKPYDCDVNEINEKERLSNIERRYNFLQSDLNEAAKLLDEQNIPKSNKTDENEDFFNFDYSLSHRIQMLIEKSQIKKENRKKHGTA